MRRRLLSPLDAFIILYGGACIRRLYNPKAREIRSRRCCLGVEWGGAQSLVSCPPSGFRLRLDVYMFLVRHIFVQTLRGYGLYLKFIHLGAV